MSVRQAVIHTRTRFFTVFFLAARRVRVATFFTARLEDAVVLPCFVFFCALFFRVGALLFVPVVLLRLVVRVVVRDGARFVRPFVAVVRFVVISSAPDGDWERAVVLLRRPAHPMSLSDVHAMSCSR